MFNYKTNSVKQLWNNLNTVCSFKKCKTKDNNTISKLIINGRTVTNSQDICNGFNQYFSTVGDNLIHNELVKNNNNSSLNLCDFKKYCSVPVRNSMFVTPTDSSELGTIIHKLINSKSPGHDNIGPKLIKYIASAIIHPLVYIYNSSLTNGMVPDIKLAKLYPCSRKAIVVFLLIIDQYVYLAFSTNY